jgi:t-SNARE complex subunit (syntaxin)
VESEFNELTEMFKDFNRTIQEQDVTIKQVVKNVDNANISVSQGLDDLKKAKSYSRFGIM